VARSLWTGTISFGLVSVPVRKELLELLKRGSSSRKRAARKAS
jgi:hypothetical protein